MPAVRRLMRRSIFVVLTVATFAAGCGGTVCDRADNQQTVLNGKVKGCPQIAGSAAAGNLSKATCEAKLLSASCTDADRALYDRMFTCIEQLEPCLSGQETAFTTKIGACRAPVQNGRTTACRQATGG